MDRIDRAVNDLREMDELASGDSPVHHFSALAKLTVTVVYILTAVSFSPYDASGLLMMVFYPLMIFQITGIPFRTYLYKMRFVLPLVLFVGLFNPLFDRRVMLVLGGLKITGGMISMFTLMIKGMFCLSASFLLAATVRIDDLCAALRKIHMPDMIVTLLLLTYRYVSVLLDEASIMNEAYHLRAPGQKGIHVSAWGSFFGQLLLRSFDRAQELYESMRLRGYRGEFPYARAEKEKGRDFLYAAGWILFFVLCRYVNIPVLLGRLFVR